ncbi:hypothetical protein RQP46_004417 [Phenoliferia psychrophenolica]
MPRDRLAASTKVLDSAPHEVPLLDSYAMHTIQRGGVSIEVFLEQVDEVKACIQDYRSSISQLSQLHSSQLRTTEESANAQVAAEIKAKRSETTALGNQVRSRLLALNSQNKAARLPTDEFTVRKNHLLSVQRAFGSVLQEFNLVEKDARERYRSRAERQYRLVKPDCTSEELSAALDLQQGSQVFGQALISSRQTGARTAFADAQARSADLSHINETITELAGLMNDLATLVFEQDDAVRDIEANAVSTEKDMVEGLGQLSRAKRLAVAARQKRWWCFWFLVVVLIIVVAVVAVQDSTNLLYRDLHGRKPELVVGASGVFLELDDGRKILDACAGAAVASIGHGDKRVIAAITSQLETLSYHHTSRLTNKAAEELANELVGHRPGGLSHAIFLSSGSEANESALKLVRQYFVEVGQPERVKIISRHNSYHGNSLGCVSLTGIPSRRRHFEPILMKNITQVSPCYPYRDLLEGESDSDYSQRLGDELEAEILRLGAGTVCAFFAETVVGAAAGNLVPVPGYFLKMREVCDKYGILLVLDEVMCGMGRTGKMHAWEHEGIVPDIQTIGKGLNGGYQALSAVLMQQRVVDGLKSGSGAFANGQTYQSHPSASIEFVTEKTTKGTFPASIPIALLLDDAMYNRGVSAYSGFGKGTRDGVVGDHILFSPPLTISQEEVETIVRVTKEAVADVFSRPAVLEAMKQ